MMVVDVEFILVETVDCAAEKIPATIKPAMPIGISFAINSGKIWSVVFVESSRYG